MEFKQNFVEYLEAPLRLRTWGNLAPNPLSAVLKFNTMLSDDEMGNAVDFGFNEVMDRCKHFLTGSYK